MRARLKWIVGLLGLAGLVAYLRGRHRSAPVPSGPDPRADDLRRTLEETREAAENVQPPVAEPESPEDVTERRRDVHERGRSALDEMAPPDAE